MKKGEATRLAILERAVQLVRDTGIESLTIGGLAEELSLSKSGLYAHFESKEGLQISVLDAAAREFTEAVVKPALMVRRGEPRLRELFERWIAWGEARGCPFIVAVAELDDRPGPVRDVLVRQQQDWRDTICQVTRTGISEGHFKKDLDVEQVAFELQGLMLSFQQANRLLRDPNARSRARFGFDLLLSRCRVKKGAAEA